MHIKVTTGSCELSNAGVLLLIFIVQITLGAIALLPWILNHEAYIPLRRKTSCVGQLPNAKDSTFALPNAKNTNMLVSLSLADANFLRWPCTFHFFCVDFIRIG